jgi:hypothetical protein
MMRASLTRITLLEYSYYHYWCHKDKKDNTRYFREDLDKLETFRKI